MKGEKGSRRKAADSWQYAVSRSEQLRVMGYVIRAEGEKWDYETMRGGDFETIRRRFSLNAQAMADEGNYEKDDLRLTTKRWIVWWQVGLTN